jgi:hypothetical protein
MTEPETPEVSETHAPNNGKNSSQRPTSSQGAKFTELAPGNPEILVGITLNGVPTYLRENEVWRQTVTMTGVATQRIETK